MKTTGAENRTKNKGERGEGGGNKKTNIKKGEKTIKNET
jgi:hypothetical protein